MLKIVKSQSMFPNYYGMVLEITNKQISEKSPNIWKLNNISTYLFQRKELKRKKRKYFKLSENESIIFQNLWNIAIAVLAGKFLVSPTCIWERKTFKSMTSISALI